MKASVALCTLLWVHAALGAQDSESQLKSKIADLFATNAKIVGGFLDDRSDKARGWGRCSFGAVFTPDAQNKAKQLSENEYKIRAFLRELEVAVPLATGNMYDEIDTLLQMLQAQGFKDKPFYYDLSSVRFKVGQIKTGLDTLVKSPENEELWQDAMKLARRNVEIMSGFLQARDDKRTTVLTPGTLERQWNRCVAPSRFSDEAKTLMREIEKNDVQLERYMRERGVEVGRLQPLVDATLERARKWQKEYSADNKEDLNKDVLEQIRDVTKQLLGRLEYIQKILNSAAGAL